MTAPPELGSGDGHSVGSGHTGERSQADTRLYGQWLAIGRATWIALAALCLILLVRGTPLFFAQIQRDCIDTACPGIPQPTGGRAGLAAIGLSPAFYASYITAINLIFAATHLLVAAILFRRRSDERVTLLGALTLAAWSVSGWSAIVPALAAAEPAWRPVGWALNAAGLISFTIFFYIFPDGRFVPDWSRWWAAALTPVLILILPEWGVDTLPAPLSILLYGVWLLSLAGSQICRYRCVSDRFQRQQTRWVVAGLAAAPLGFLALLFLFTIAAPALQQDVLANMVAYGVLYSSLLLVPLTLGLAILRHRLWDIAPILNRTLAYGGLWLVITLGYVGLTALLGIAAGSVLPASFTILVTIIAAQLFQPVRRRLESLADRWVFGERASRYELLTRIGTTLESAYDLRELIPQVITTIHQGFEVAWVRIFLGQSPESEPLRVVLSDGGAVPSADAEPALLIPLIHAGKEVGVIACGPKVVGTFDGQERELLATLGRQVALAIHNASLSAELAQRLEEIQRQARELAASRTRIVQAGEDERRRIERNIHDGVQQQLVVLLAKIGLARNQLARDPLLAERTLAELRDDARQALEDLRELVHGIHPPVLSDRGLLEAIEARVARLPLAVTIEARGIERGTRYAEEIEGAAYFCVCEGLANILKHAAAAHASVSLSTAAGTLWVEVRDDGRGFEPAEAASSGLRGLDDRIEALGGVFQIRSAPGHGTCLAACLPIKQA